jgi:flagellar hook-associated protein 2
VVDAINAAKAGVTASVATDGGTGKVHLKLVGTNSGQASGFAVSTTDTGAGTNSLATLAYNGTNTANYPAQTLTSSIDYGTNATATTFKSGTLSIQMGTTGPSGTFTASGNPINVTVADNSSLNSIAAAINTANAGVTATVVTDQTTNKVHLKLVGSGSNSASTFTIAGTTTSGYAGTGTNGLEGLNYASGNTGNFTATTVQAAQDAKYTVNGNPFQSPSNLSVPVAAGINLNLLKTGSTVVSIPGSPTAVTNTANSLVSTVNGLIQVIQQMTGSNGLLASDPTVASQLTNDLSLTMNNSFNASKYTQSLAAIGVTRQSDGTYAVNTTTLDQAFSSDSAGVQNILSMAASSLMNMMSAYIGTNGTVTAKMNALQYQLPTDTTTGNLSNYTANTPTQQQASNAYTMLSALYGSGVSSLFG